MDEKRVSIDIPSETKYIREVSSKIIDSLAPLKLNEDELFEIRLSAEEAVRNAIVHGNKSDDKKLVKISCWVDGSDLNIEIADEGKGFDHKKIPDPTEDANLTKGSGRGVYLIKKLMDKVEFIGAGNKIRMTKRIK